MKRQPKRANAQQELGESGEAMNRQRNVTPPMVTGQCAQVLGSPEWPRPGFFEPRPTASQIEIDFNPDEVAS